MFRKLPKVNNHPLGEHSTNLATQAVPLKTGRKILKVFGNKKQ
jgi:hypothetical protein